MSNDNGILTYRTYRIGTGDLASLIAPALSDYHDRYGCLPAGVTVHETLTDEVREALTYLETPIPVTGCGGCLAWEIWLQVGGHGRERPQAVQQQGGTVAQNAVAGQQDTQDTQGPNDDPRSLLARVAAAQVEMTPERARQLILQLEATDQ